MKTLRELAASGMRPNPETYRFAVDEFVMVFGDTPKENQSFSHQEVFKPDSHGPRREALARCRRDAMAWYEQRLKGFVEKRGVELGGVFFPFVAPGLAVARPSSAFSIDVSFLYETRQGDVQKMVIFGDEEAECSEVWDDVDSWINAL